MSNRKSTYMPALIITAIVVGSVLWLVAWFILSLADMKVTGQSFLE